MAEVEEHFRDELDLKSNVSPVSCLWWVEADGYCKSSKCLTEAVVATMFIRMKHLDPLPFSVNSASIFLDVWQLNSEDSGHCEIRFAYYGQVQHHLGMHSYIKFVIDILVDTPHLNHFSKAFILQIL